MNKIIIGTRKSKLAMWQAEFVKKKLLLRGLYDAAHLVGVSTLGDLQQQKAIDTLGGKTVFVKEIERALELGDVDVAVHSAKDLSAELDKPFCIPAFMGGYSREDVLVSRRGIKLSDLPLGAVIGTGSLRRQYQLQTIRSDLRFKLIRGNVETRIRKVMQGECDATVLAAAGLERLGLTSFISERFRVSQMVPAGGQGIIACEVLKKNERVIRQLRKRNCLDAEVVAKIEFGILAALGAGCHTPVGVYVEAVEHELVVYCFYASDDGAYSIKVNKKYPTSSSIFQVVEDFARVVREMWFAQTGSLLCQR